MRAGPDSSRRVALSDVARAGDAGLPGRGTCAARLVAVGSRVPCCSRPASTRWLWAHLGPGPDDPDRRHALLLGWLALAGAQYKVCWVSSTLACGNATGGGRHRPRAGWYRRTPSFGEPTRPASTMPGGATGRTMTVVPLTGARSASASSGYANAVSAQVRCAHVPGPTRPARLRRSPACSSTRKCRPSPRDRCRHPRAAHERATGAGIGDMRRGARRPPLLQRPGRGGSARASSLARRSPLRAGSIVVTMRRHNGPRGHGRSARASAASP